MRKAELKVVAQEGKRVRTGFLDVRALSSPLSHPRVGIVVPKRGRTTTDRNRLKRRVRELVRIYILPDVPPIDLLVHVRAEAYTASFAELQIELVRVAQRLKDIFRRLE